AINEEVETIAVGNSIEVEAAMVVFVSANAMLPPAGRGQVELAAGHKVTVARKLVGIRNQKRHAVEVPLAGHASAPVRVTHSQAERSLRGEQHAEIRAFQRVGIIVVGALTGGVELVAKKVVVEAAACA